MNINELTEKCRIIKNAFRIDVQVIDKDLKLILHISKDDEPLVITETRKSMYPVFQEALLEAKKNSFCFYTDSFHLSYITIGIKEEEHYKGMTIVGPFLTEKVNDHFLWSVLKKNNLEQSWIKPLENYYKSITNVGSTSMALADVFVNILANPHFESHFKTIDSNHVDKKNEVLPLQDFEQKEKNINFIYELEKKYLHFIETGDTEKALEMLVDISGDFDYRVPGNPLRARKNITFVSNSIYRIAAERGGVPPQYLHEISEKFSIKVEQAVTISELEMLEIAMIIEYCNAVKNFAIKGHSSAVKKAIMYINLHFHENINLQSVADEIGFNRTYLAKRFKEEMNITVISYIQKKRIDEAAFLIEQGMLSITDISEQVGFSSYNYFFKVFKDVKGMTPTEYKRTREWTT
jgi:AraC-like DNA-binding protein